MSLPGWIHPLQALQNTPKVSYSSAAELSSYQAFVRHKIEAAIAEASKEEVVGLCSQLEQALKLVLEGKATSGHEKAVELLGFASLYSTCLVSGTASSAFSTSSVTSSSTSSSTTCVGEFKVPALPAKRSRQLKEQQEVPLLSASKQQQEQPCATPQQPQQQQQPRKHSAPKRRATPQVLPGGPFSITPTAPPSSSTHGETCCDEQLLSCWCPISGKRLKTSSIVPAEGGSSCSSSSNRQQQQTPLSAVPSPQHQQPGAGSIGFSSSSSVSSLSGISSAPAASLSPVSASQQQQQRRGSSPKAPGMSERSAARAASHVEAAAALKRLIHEDPSASKPAADVLLFHKGNQQPIRNWTGVIKHRQAGRVVELCTVTLQVPEPFLEEFPATLYAADVHHRRAVSLGRHVVCRATLGALTEHQLAGLSAMARGQLVALCALQTAELHLVPYFDNKNLVRMVGFLKIKAE